MMAGTVYVVCVSVCMSHDNPSCDIVWYKIVLMLIDHDKIAVSLF